MTLLRSSVWAILSALFLAGSRFAVNAVLARRLSIEEFGLYAYSQWLVDLGFMVCAFGVPSLATRYFAEYRDAPNLLSSFVIQWRRYARILPWITSAIVLLGSVLSQIKLTNLGAVALAIWGLTNGIWAMQTAALAGMQRFDLLLGSNAIYILILLGAILGLPKHLFSHETLFAIAAVASATAASIGYKRTQSPMSGIESNGELPMKEIKTYALNVWISGLLASLVWSRGEFPLVRQMLGDVSVAHYTAALTVFGGVIQAVMLCVSGVAPHLSRMWGGGSKSEVIELARTIMDIQLLLAGASSLVIVLYGDVLISFLFTSKYEDAAAPLAILGLGLVAFAVSSQSYLLQLATEARFNRDSIFIGLLVLYVGVFVMTPTFGLMGAAFSRTVALLSMGGLTMLHSVKRWGRASVSISNFCFVLLILGVAIMIKQTIKLEGTGIRLSILISLLGVVIFVLRAPSRTFVVVKVWQQIVPHVSKMVKALLA